MKAAKLITSSFVGGSLLYYFGVRYQIIQTDFSVYQLFYNQLAKYDLSFSVQLTKLLLKRNLLWQIDPSKHVSLLGAKIGGLTVPNILGIAAGYDAQGYLTIGLQDLGFGFIELGSISTSGSRKNTQDKNVYSQNEIKYVSELPIIGVLNMKALLLSLRKRNQLNVPLAVSILPSEDTQTYTPYLIDKDIQNTFRELVGLTDIVVINLIGSDRINSSYRKHLRQTQTGVTSLLNSLRQCSYQEIGLSTAIEYEREEQIANESFKADVCSMFNSQFVGESKDRKLIPDIYVKIGSNEDQGFWNDIIKLSNERVLDGIILEKSSGQNNNEYLNKLLELASKTKQESIPIISVGGISNGQDIINRIEHGASACQILSAFLKNGPTENIRLLKEVEDQLKERQISTILALKGVKLN